MHHIYSTSRREFLGSKERNSLPCTLHSVDFQTKIVQSTGWLPTIVCCNVAKINDPIDSYYIYKMFSVSERCYIYFPKQIIKIMAIGRFRVVNLIQDNKNYLLMKEFTSGFLHIDVEHKQFFYK